MFKFKIKYKKWKDIANYVTNYKLYKINGLFYPIYPNYEDGKKNTLDCLNNFIRQLSLF